MRVAVVGATGTIGAPVADLLARSGHEVLRASRHVEPRVDLDDPASIDRFYDTVGELDAVLSVAGGAAMGALADLTDAEFDLSLHSKLRGQANLVRKGIRRVRAGGVFVVTGGAFAYAPWPKTAMVALANAGLEGFVRAAALDLGDARRILIVHPPLVRETAKAFGMDEAPWPPAAEVAEIYLQALSGTRTGEALCVPGHGPS